MELLKNEEPMYLDRVIKNMRIIPLKSSSSTADPSIVIALVVSSSNDNNNTSVQVIIPSLTIREGTLTTTIDEETYEDMPLPHSLKAFTDSAQEAGLLLVNFKPEFSTNRTTVVVEHIIPSSQSGWRRYTYKDVFDSGTANGAWSVLVGNILSLPSQSTQLLTLNTIYPLTTLRLYALPNPSQTPTPSTSSPLTPAPPPHPPLPIPIPIQSTSTPTSQLSSPPTHPQNPVSTS
ncbi:MAG: hypothetical protein LQ349_009934 [Xanthoria aureola]|nr:MAG: hypothetical protein LQ349_009934 [Xanthoria aureola]